ncbi:MAG: NVEALA domain-containing protein [Dysgonamonadaceae bacterium]|jgi:hypothetical protein|nr:NVEALA domain-containing protein [Dysgonamonadaceae bacterium]
MKTKQIFGLTATVSLIALAILNLSINSKKSTLPSVSLSNIEALSDRETGAGITTQEECVASSQGIEVTPQY